MDAPAITQVIGGLGGLVTLSAPGLYLYKRLVRQMTKSNRDCEKRSDELEKELRHLRDVTIAQNTDALHANTKALDRFIDRFGGGSGSHQIP